MAAVATNPRLHGGHSGPQHVIPAKVGIHGDDGLMAGRRGRRVLFWRVAGAKEPLVDERARFFHEMLNNCGGFRLANLRFQGGLNGGECALNMDDRLRMKVLCRVRWRQLRAKGNCTWRRARGPW